MHKLLLSGLVTTVLVGCAEQPATSNNTSEKASTQKAEALKLHVESPDWRDQVIYFAMTDRFNDGDPSNNDQGVGEYDPTKESHYSGGDIQGVIDKLDYLKGMGITSVWLTPIVENQWWSSASNYSGYHGYWATHFNRVDPHMGTMDTYKQLSHQLHSRDMFLIQDIVVNHTGNFFNYKGGQSGYNPENTAENFVLLEPETAKQTKPVQAPFDMIDRNNPEHAKADIYNWTPSITDYRNPDHQFTYQLASLADLNTKNPVVIDAMKDVYGKWIRDVGVDAFRIDTVRYVEHDFFHHFMHDKNGIHATAKETGRDHFLAFGEVFETSKAYNNDAEHSVASYYGTEEKPALNSLISFPLHRELRSVFAQGYPTDQLAYRIEQHLNVYKDPYTVPTFIDNHDMARFLMSGNPAALKQAIATIFTIPGIPTIYQGTEQAMIESRQAMFKGGFNADKDYFDAQSELYQFIKTLAEIRTTDRIFTRGNLNIVATDKNGSGLLAYTRSYQGRNVVVIFNTSEKTILVDKAKIAQKGTKLTPIFGTDETLSTNSQGQLTTELAPRSIIIAEMTDETVAAKASADNVNFTTALTDAVYTQDIIVKGTSAFKNDNILIVKNRSLNTAVTVKTDGNGEWEYRYPVVNLGDEKVSLLAYHKPSAAVSDALVFNTHVDKPQLALSKAFPKGDADGVNGKVLPPQHEQSIGQMDIVNVKTVLGGEVLRLTLKTAAVTDDWIPENGFDNVAFSLFFDTPQAQGTSTLPLLNATMTGALKWNIAHVVYGWGNTTFSNVNSDAHHQGDRFGVAPGVTVDKATQEITFEYRASDFGIDSWLDSQVYITTWDITGEGVYREVETEPHGWSFSADSHDTAKILDRMVVKISHP